ncbi:MAG: putative nucleotide-diphospho-sugar transferase [Candidatus Omnitrophica bacterium]|nr:putative nucleotide-diphospho-sugar transferase [Candidatus Omnitrophota bacterium]
MKKIKLYSIYTDEESILKDVFLKTIKDNWELNICHWGKLGRNNGDWGTPEFIALMRRRVEHLVGVIEKEQGETIIWSDIDIQFFGKCTDLIERALADKEIVFLSEHWPKKEVSAGFVAIRCNPKTLLFYKSVLKTDFEKLSYHDQSAVNNILTENAIGIKWDILPSQFWAMSHSEFPPLDIVLHHANVTFPCVKDGRTVGSVEQKIEQIKKIRQYILRRRRRKWLSHIKVMVKKRFPDQFLFTLKNIKMRKK